MARCDLILGEIMFVLLISIRVKPNMERAAEAVFTGPFRVAISAQPGFKDAIYLRPDSGGDYVLFVAFDNQHLQQQWVATALHAQVWAQMETNIDTYSVETYCSV